MKKLSKIFHNDTFMRVIFWGYNILGLLFTLFVSIPIAFTSTIFRDSVPWDTILTVYILLFIPIGSILLTVLTKLKKEPKKLASFFFAVEMPLFFICFFRVIFVRQITPIYWLLFLSALLALAFFTVLLFKDNFKKVYQKVIAFLSFESAIVISGYFALLLLFFIPPLVGVTFDLFEEIFEELGDFIVSSGGFIIIHILLGLILLILGVGLFIISPIVGVILYKKYLQHVYKNLKENIKGKKIQYLGYGFAVFYILFGVLLSWQNTNKDYLDTHKQLIEATTFEEQQELLADFDEDSMKSELKDNFLSKYRYIADNSINSLSHGYEKILNFPDATAEGIQTTWNYLALPFVFQGDFREDSEEAIATYEKFFDGDIIELEKDDILDAYKSTHTRDNLIQAGMLDEDEEIVKVTSRKIYAEESLDGLVTKVSFKEEYENLSDDIQEVYYEFTLPEEAVITGLWLGPDLELEGEIAPRGAASETYENQYVVRRDPALLEQLGPRQYRLKVFPIPPEDPNGWTARDLQNRGLDEGETQKVKFEYVVMNTNEGIPLPEFTEKRNVFTDNSTEYTYVIDGEEVENDPESTYLATTSEYACPAAAYTSATSVGSIMFVPHNINPGVQYVKENYDCTEQNMGGGITKLQIALLLDASYSNQVEDWSTYLKEELEIEELMEENTIDIYFFNTNLSQKVILSDDLLERGITVTHFGQTDRAQAYLNLINRIEKYSMALMITDDSDFDIEKEENIIFNPKMPLYLVHRTGDIPQYTDLLTDIVLKSGGGVFTDPKEAVEDYWMSLVVAMNQQPISDYSIIDVDDQGIWLYSDSTTQVLTTAYQTKPLATDTFFAKLGNRKLVDYYIARKDTKNLEELDQIHAVAVDAAIVTPFSSYIALENDQQKEELEQAKNKESRFDPDFEKSESLINPGGSGAFRVSGTPEPEEWALIIISVFMVLYFYRNKILKWVKDRI